MILILFQHFLYKQQTNKLSVQTLFRYKRDYLCETSLKTNVATDEGKDRNEM